MFEPRAPDFSVATIHPLRKRLRDDLHERDPHDARYDHGLVDVTVHVFREPFPIALHDVKLGRAEVERDGHALVVELALRLSHAVVRPFSSTLISAASPVRVPLESPLDVRARDS